jgi:hypothetical protein
MRSGKRLLFGFLVGVATIAVVAAGIGGAATNGLAVNVTADPGAVTKGGDASFTVTVDSVGNNAWNNVIVTVPVPAAGSSPATLKYAACSAGGVLDQSSGVRCTFAKVGADQIATVFFVYGMPLTGTDVCEPGVAACIDIEVGVTGQEGTVAPDSPRSKGKPDAFGGSVELPFIDTPDADKRRAATYALEACGGTTSTLETNDAISLANPIVTEVCIPSVPGAASNPLHPGLSVVLNERDHVEDQDVGKTPQVSDICIPAVTSNCAAQAHLPFEFDDPATPAIEQATFTFTLWNKSFNGQISKVFEDGVQVSNLPGADPRVLSITSTTGQDGITTIVVLSSDNGGWDFN